MRDVVLYVVALAAVFFVLDAAIRTFVLPRGRPVLLTYLVFRGVRLVLGVFANPRHGYERRDRVMALYAPLSLVALPAVSLIMLFLAFTLMFLGLEDHGWRDAVATSGSSLLTLGFERPPSIPGTLLAFAAAAIGLGLLALVIAYLPTIYGAFSRREVMVTDLAVRAGTPPTAREMLERAHRAGYLHDMDRMWDAWTQWFVELSETHTSLSSLSHFRSPHPNRSWITAAGAVLDAASLRMSTLDIPFSAAGGLCIRSGYLALREIAQFFGFEPDENPHPEDPISVARAEFDEVYDRLLAAGLPLKADRDQAWRDFAGWRVNYDAVLITLAALVMAPYGPWTSDRSLREPLPRTTPVSRAANQVRQLRRAGQR